jgi:ketosteroid isomerase-like protein
VSVVRRYLDAVATFDWDAARDCLSEDVHRVGPFGDAYTGRDRYLGYLRDLMPTLAGYRMEIERVFDSDDRRSAVAELTETVELDGRVVVTPESLVFDLGPEGTIVAIRIYTQRRLQSTG